MSTAIFYMVWKMIPILTEFLSLFVTLSEELRSKITQDACMCEAQIMFQEKVQSAFQELNRKHILYYLNFTMPILFYYPTKQFSVQFIL